MNRRFVMVSAVLLVCVSSFGLGSREKTDSPSLSTFADKKAEAAKAQSAEEKTEEKQEDAGVFVSADWKLATTGDEVFVEGRVRLVGSDPLGELVISDATGDVWYLDAQGQELLAAYEQKLVRVRGKVNRKEMTLANGRKLPDRVYLENVEVF